MRLRSHQVQDMENRYTDKQEMPNELRVTGEEAYLRRGRLSMKSQEDDCSTSSEPLPKPKLSAAERMMAKMGWKKGDGLGKSKQGIKRPLEAQKTARSSGIIVEAGDSQRKRVSKIEKVSLKNPFTLVR